MAARCCVSAAAACALSPLPSGTTDIRLVLHSHAGLPELLDALRPETAFISVGSNSYGHPAEDTLRRLARAGCAVYRTDHHGTVYLSFK